MTRTVLVLVGLLSVSAAVSAQTTAEVIARAVAAAPPNMQEGATVVRWRADHTYETLRQGTNRLFCYDRSGEPGRAAFAVQCTSLGNLERVAQNRRFEAIADRAERQKQLDAAEANGTRVKPEFGSVWFDMNGTDQASARIHRTIAVPGATSQSLGLPTSGQQGGAWIMDAGTTTAHIMVPGT